MPATPLPPLLSRRQALVVLGDGLRHVAADGPALVGPTFTAPGPLQLLGATVAVGSPPVPPKAGDTWTAVVQLRPSDAAASDVATAAVDLSKAPAGGGAFSVPIPIQPVALRLGDQIVVGVVPQGSPVALDAPSFTLLLSL